MSDDFYADVLAIEALLGGELPPNSSKYPRRLIRVGQGGERPEPVRIRGRGPHVAHEGGRGDCGCGKVRVRVPVGSLSE